MKWANVLQKILKSPKNLQIWRENSAETVEVSFRKWKLRRSIHYCEFKSNSPSHNSVWYEWIQWLPGSGRAEHDRVWILIAEFDFAFELGSSWTNQIWPSRWLGPNAIVGVDVYSDFDFFFSLFSSTIILFKGKI